MADNMIFVTNMDEINRNLKLSGPLVANAMRRGLRDAAEPVRQDAGRLSQTKLSGMKRAKVKPPPWSVQRTGQTVHEVYIAPTQRGRRFFRTDGDRQRAGKFVEAMLGRAYEPALERNRTLVLKSVDAWVDRAIRGV